MAIRRSLEPPVPAKRGRPRSKVAEAHVSIMDAVYELLQEKSVRDLTMEEIAQRARVGKPTLYKWWPTKATLVLAMFHERLVGKASIPATATIEEAIRARVRNLIPEFNGLFGKVIADLIAEGQSEPAIMRILYEQHIGVRFQASSELIETAKSTGELLPDINAHILIEEIFAPIYFRLLVRHAPLTQKFGDELVDQALRGLRSA